MQLLAFRADDPVLVDLSQDVKVAQGPSTSSDETWFQAMEWFTSATTLTYLAMRFERTLCGIRLASKT
jgi:hypothetical protein